MATEVQAAPPLLEQKFSRYRSVKKASAKQAISSPPLPPIASPRQDERVARSASRYRRARPGALPLSAQDQEHGRPPMTPDSQESQSQLRTFPMPKQPLPETSPVDATNPALRSRTISEPNQPGSYEPTSVRGISSKSTAERPQTIAERQSRDQRHEHKARHEARQVSRVEGERKRRSKQKLQVEKETQRIQAEETVDCHTAPSVQPTLSSKASFTRDRFVLPSILKRDKATIMPSPWSRDTKEELKRKISSPMCVDAGAGGLAPGTNVPISSVNAGERVCSRSLSTFERANYVG